MRLNHKEFALFHYEQNPSKTDKFKLGDVVINEEKEVGVILQCHGNDEYRTDMFGNCCLSEIKKASPLQITLYRPSLFGHKSLTVD